MSSGFGRNGGPGKCFASFQELMICYHVDSEVSAPSQCKNTLKNYLSCVQGSITTPLVQKDVVETINKASTVPYLNRAE
ncbi:uncharacterized protein V1510DRAFT_419732 [Dipodascopsis tothii]|uniref:uncharacterized protein n=1 Tax=Dipodascopsis tothii TaxID=44089 RepID=UPI0034CD01D2